jgi:AraC family transcriptional regulator
VPEGHVTTTTTYADTDDVIDQVFWQYVGQLHDRLAAQDFAATVFTEPAQLLHLGGPDRADHPVPPLS